MNQTPNDLGATQLAVTKGLRVNGPQDDASSFAISLNLKGTIAGDTAVQTALSTGESTVNVAVNAVQSIANQLSKAKAKIVQADQTGLDNNAGGIAQRLRARAQPDRYDRCYRELQR